MGGGSGFQALRPLAAYPVAAAIRRTDAFSPAGSFLGWHATFNNVAYAPNGTFSIIPFTNAPTSASVNDDGDAVYFDGTNLQVTRSGNSSTIAGHAQTTAADTFVVSATNQVFGTLRASGSPASLVKESGGAMVAVPGPNLGGNTESGMRFLGAPNDNSILIEVTDTTLGKRYFQRAANGTYTEFTAAAGGRNVLEVRRRGGGLEIAMTDVVTNPTIVVIRHADGSEQTFPLPAGTTHVNTAGQFDDLTVFAGCNSVASGTKHLPYVWRNDGSANWLQNIVPSRIDGYIDLVKVTDSGAYVSELKLSSAWPQFTRFSPAP